MARLIVDTSALIAAERGAITLGDAVADGDDVAIAAVTVAELLVGVELATPERRDARRLRVDGILSVLPVEDYDVDAARAHATLLAHARRAGAHPGAHDLIIAAIAVSSGREVVTSDVRGFALPGVTARLVDA